MGGGAAGVEVDELDDHDLYVPHFQRVSISGEDTSGVSYYSTIINLSVQYKTFDYVIY